ncbi:MAG: zinc-ribbon domain-containing protein [Gemmataceae bacterium]|nr:zinc-ribbon domain-containing protein [Gemmataceae bacterium]
MPEVIDCPSCRRKLRLPEELLGRFVQCPTCGQTFAAPAAEAALPSEAEPLPAGREESRLPSADQPLQLSLDPDDAPARPARNVPPPPRPLRAVPLGPPRRPGSADDLMPCPCCGEEIDPDAPRCRFCGEVLDEADRARGRATRRRRPWEPHRGPLILTLGISSLVLFWVCGYLGLLMGLAAWTMGRRDLNLMRAQRMDPEGMGHTKGGYVCGIIGTILDSLWLCLLPRLLA